MMGKAMNAEQKVIQLAMDRLFARVCELRDIVDGDDWDDKMDSAAYRAWKAMREFSGALGKLDYY